MDNNIVVEQECKRKVNTGKMDMIMALIGIILLLLSLSLIFFPILS
ncbi:MAG: LPXTG cell wall anchor domain-containing protein [Lachnospiraceae bacterium]|nr:LPXTG cell wall anchor domain-containing protein [Lachnospiraceae bacterium]